MVPELLISDLHRSIYPGLILLRTFRKHRGIIQKDELHFYLDLQPGHAAEVQRCEEQAPGTNQ